jgi:hypothetical protein
VLPACRKLPQRQRTGGRGAFAGAALGVALVPHGYFSKKLNHKLGYKSNLLDVAYGSIFFS